MTKPLTRATLFVPVLLFIASALAGADAAFASKVLHRGNG